MRTDRLCRDEYQDQAPRDSRRDGPEQRRPRPGPGPGSGQVRPGHPGPGPRLQVGCLLLLLADGATEHLASLRASGHLCCKSMEPVPDSSGTDTGEKPGIDWVSNGARLKR